MKAIAIERFGGPEVLVPSEQPLPHPGPGELRVRLAFAGVNFIDVYMRNGTYAKSQTYQTPLPMVIGMEGAGVIDALGEGVSGFAPGETVAWCIVRGAYAEQAIVPAARAVKVPEGVPPDVACALMLQGCTAHYLTHSAFALQPGQVCLVHAGAGGVGQLLVQIAKARGATVIATVGSEEKAAIAKARGADHAILYRSEDFREAVRRLTDGRGVDVVYDSVGKDTVHASIRCLKRRGLCVLYGASSGSVASITPLELAEAGSVFFTRPHLADYIATPEELSGRTGDLFRMWREGRLEVAIDRTYALADARAAHEYLEARQTKGKLLLSAA